MKWMIISVVIIVIGVSIYGYAKTRYQEPYYITLANRLLDQHIREMQNDGYALKMRGGGFHQDVNMLAIGFYAKGTPTVEDARPLYVKAVERFLARVNNDADIHPYLHDYPFNADNLEYELNFRRLPVDASGVAPIVFVSVIKGNVLYRVDNPAYEDTNSLRTIHREPYTEALRIVREAGLLSDDSGG